MSTYHDQWKALSARISGLVRAADHRAKATVDDAYGIAKLLRRTSETLVLSIEALATDPTLPVAAKTLAVEFTSSTKSLVGDVTGQEKQILDRVWRFLTELLIFESEMSLVLADTQQVIRVRSERAFVHLQRLLVVDLDFQSKWKNAYATNELACERLGAVHLLYHGIWAFKVDAAGARTDLVFQDQRVGIDDGGYADGIVLTEWKKADNQNDADNQFVQARSQMKRYSSGALSSTELTDYRYAIVVTERQIIPPADYVDGTVTYRHINIAVAPLPPSKAPVS